MFYALVLIEECDSLCVANLMATVFFVCRAVVEESYVKILSKLHKTVSAIPESHFG